MHSGTFWNILHAFWNILLSFWNILHAFGKIQELSACILKHSGTFWIILDAVEGCRRIFSGWPCTDRQTDRQTYIRTCWAASLQLKITHVRLLASRAHMLQLWSLNLHWQVYLCLMIFLEKMDSNRITMTLSKWWLRSLQEAIRLTCCKVIRGL